MRGAGERAPAGRAGGPPGPAVRAAGRDRGLPPGQRQRELAAVRQAVVPACAEPGSRGHGPRWLWTRTVPGRGTIGRQLRAEELGKVRAELESYQQFAALAEEIAEVSEAICEARPVPAAAPARPLSRRGKKGALRSARGGRRRRGSHAGRVGGGVAGPRGRPGGGRAGDPRGGAGAGPGGAGAAAGRRRRLPGPAGRLRAGHQAGFVSYRDKTIDTVLGPVTLRRAWYHCAECGHGFAPRDAELGVAGDTMSPGLARMTDRAAAAVPFGAAAKLVGELAGISLTGERAAPPRRGRRPGRRRRHRSRGRRDRRPPGRPPAGRRACPGHAVHRIDGTGVPMIAAETEGRDGKGEDGKARTREVKLCCCVHPDQQPMRRAARSATRARRPTWPPSRPPPRSAP